MKGQFKKLGWAVFFMILSLTVGVVGFISIEKYDLLSAFYMAIITISTVGFTEVQELSDAGRLFTSLYIIFNLGIFTYVISILTSYLFEGKLKQLLSAFMSDRELGKLNQHVIVCGYGRNGSKACDELLKEKQSFVVIEKDASVIQGESQEMKKRMLEADATIDDNLKKAGISKASVIIITTSSDAANVFISLTARELKPDIKIIARASEKESESKLYRAGADFVIMPDDLGGLFMAQMITKPVVIEFLDLLTGRSRGEDKYHLESIHYADLKPKYKNKTLAQLDVKNLVGATVVAVKDNVKGMIPNPPDDTFIGENDTMVILCSEDNASNLLHTLTDPAKA